MREALGSIPSVSMHQEVAALSHGWFGCRSAKLTAVGTLSLLGRYLRWGSLGTLLGHVWQAASWHARHYSESQVHGQLTHTYVGMAPRVRPARLFATAAL